MFTIYCFLFTVYFLWKRFLFYMKSGTMKFLLNACIDTFPTAANLKRWEKSSSDKCKLCRNRQTTNHCLNICQVALDSRRFTWRHNNVINYIIQSLDSSKYTMEEKLVLIIFHCTLKNKKKLIESSISPKRLTVKGQIIFHIVR